MKLLILVVLSGGFLFFTWCTTPAPIEFEEEMPLVIENPEVEEPTVESEIPETTDEEIVTQTDTSL